MCGSWVVLVIKNPPVNAGDLRPRFDPWDAEDPPAWQLTLMFFHEESHGQMSLRSYSPYSCKESDTTEAI